MKIEIPGKSWNDFFMMETEKDYFFSLIDFVDSEYRKAVVFPPSDQIFRAFELTGFDQLKVVLLAQDPYCNDNQANGLAFSVNDGVSLPPSLVNIKKSIVNDCGACNVKEGDLSFWANQGVLLLNSVMTVRRKETGSHRTCGWETFTDNCIRYISDNSSPVVFMLWGNYAKKKKDLIDASRHLVIENVHPSPLSLANPLNCSKFMNSKMFSQTNLFLEKNGKEPIQW